MLVDFSRIDIELVCPCCYQPNTRFGFRWCLCTKTFPN